MKALLFALFVGLLMVGCGEDKQQQAENDPSIPPAIPCVACGKPVSKTVEKCVQCGHPTPESVVAYKVLRAKREILNQMLKEEQEDRDRAFKRVANRDKELEYREDGLWYEIGSKETFTGVAVSYHEDDVTMKSRTKVKEGSVFGLIEEWDKNGKLVAPKFKDEF